MARGGDLTEVAYGVAQPTREDQTVDSMPVTGGHLSVAIETSIKGFWRFLNPGSNVRLEPWENFRPKVVSWPDHMLGFDLQKR